MLYYTHLAFGFLIGLIYKNIIGIGIDPYIFMFLVLFGALLPDIDNPKSKIGRNVKIIGWLFEHRGFFHSIFPLILLTILSFSSWGWFFTPITIGYFSHLFIDLFTLQGIKPFYPFKQTLRGFVRTGSITENILFVLLLIINFILMLRIF